MKALVLLSGGLDSCVATAMSVEDGFQPGIALNVFYGQRHARETKSFAQIARHYGMTAISLSLESLAPFIKGATALINTEEKLPVDRVMSEMTAHVPRTYVPGRNTILLALAQSIAEANNIERIVVGFNAVDYSGYPDCRPIFVEAWNHLAKYATSKGYYGKPIEVVAPIVNMSKASVVFHGRRLRAPLEQTWSCYAGGEKACGKCDSCIIRWNAFVANNMTDPVPYEHEPKSVGL